MISSQNEKSGRDVLVVGHVTRDIFSDHEQLGGAAAYASRAASAFGYRTALVTASPLSPLLKPLQDDAYITLYHRQCQEFTTFTINYTGSRRELSLINRAPDLSPDDIPEVARKIPLAYIAPVIGECGRAVIESLKSEYIVVGAQGWLRQVNDRGAVVPRIPFGDEIPSNVNGVVFSVQDIPDAEAIAGQFARSTDIVALTRGAKGVTLLLRNEKIGIPAMQSSRVVDPTGAGDVFGVVFGIELYAGKDVIDAAHSAMWAAARVVEGKGMGNLSKAIADRTRKTE